MISLNARSDVAKSDVSVSSASLLTKASLDEGGVRVKKDSRLRIKGSDGNRDRSLGILLGGTN